LDDLRDTAMTENGYDEVETPFDAAAELADDLDPASAWSIVHLAGPIACGWGADRGHDRGRRHGSAGQAPARRAPG
jgi:hypothetical protein